MPLTSIDSAVLAGNISALLSHARRAKGIARRRHAYDLLERALLNADPGTVTQQQRDAARRIGLDRTVCDEPDIDVPPHAVLVPLVLPASPTMQRAVGVVRYMRVAFEASTLNGYHLAFDAAAARAVSDALQLAATRLDRNAVDHAYCLTSVHPDAFTSLEASVQLSGPSLGAAAFVSAVSLWSERAVHKGAVVTGRLLGDRVRAVGGIEEKIQAVVASRPDVKRVIVPTETLAHARRVLRRYGAGIQVIGVRTLDELAEAALEPAATRPLSIQHRLAALRLEFDRGWQGFQWANVREHAQRLVSVVPEHSVEQRVDLLSMLGATQERAGSVLRSLETLGQALQLARSPLGSRWVSDRVKSRLHQRLAMTQRRLCRFNDARRSAALAIRFAKRGHHADELYKALGCAGLVELAAGRPQRAVASLEASLALTHEHAPDSCLRAHGYLIEAHARAGDAAGSEAQWIEALEHSGRAALTSLPSSSEAWLRTSRGTALWILGHAADAVATLDVPVVGDVIATKALPGMWARRALGVSLMNVGRVEQGQALLAASEVAYGPSLEANLAFGAQLNVLCEASALLSRDHWDSDIHGRAYRALQRFPDYLRAATLERARSRVLEGIASRSRPDRGTITALHNLIGLATRIA